MQRKQTVNMIQTFSLLYIIYIRKSLGVHCIVLLQLTPDFVQFETPVIPWGQWMNYVQVRLVRKFTYSFRHKKRKKKENSPPDFLLGIKEFFISYPLHVDHLHTLLVLSLALSYFIIAVPMHHCFTCMNFTFYVQHC